MALVLFTLLLSPGSSGQDQNALRISITRIETTDSKPSSPEFAITLENKGVEDVVVVLGALVGRTLYPHALSFLLTDERGQQSRLRCRGPVRVGGRVDPYIVGLPSHATYVLRMLLTQFTSPYTGEGRTEPPAEGDLDPMLPHGGYTIQATLQAPGGDASDVYGNRLMNLWTAAASSNVLRFSVAQPSGGVAQSPISSEDRAEVATIEAAKHSIVRDIEETLPRMTFEAWLRRAVGPQAVMKWEVNDCGEQIGTSADSGRDLPVCVEVQVDLPGRLLSLSLAVGTMQTGLRAGQAKFFAGHLGAPSPNAKRTWIKKLSQVPAIIGQ